MENLIYQYRWMMGKHMTGKPNTRLVRVLCMIKKIVDLSCLFQVSMWPLILLSAILRNFAIFYIFPCVNTKRYNLALALYFGISVINFLFKIQIQ